MAIKTNETVQNQNIKLYKIGHENNLNNTDAKYINLNLFNLLNVLIILIKTCNKSKLNLKIKNMKVIQEHVEKKKQYAMSRILY